MKRLLALIAAALLSVTLGVALSSGTPAHASGCVTGNFDLQNINDRSFYIVGEGHNQQVQQVNNGTTAFCLVDGSSANWYQFEDATNGLCLNVANYKLYEDSCTDTTPEQWNQTIPGAYYWENRHYGEVMTALCSLDSDVVVFADSDCSGGGYNQQWATPGA